MRYVSIISSLHSGFSLCLQGAIKKMAHFLHINDIFSNITLNSVKFSSTVPDQVCMEIGLMVTSAQKIRLFFYHEVSYLVFNAKKFPKNKHSFQVLYIFPLLQLLKISLIWNSSWNHLFLLFILKGVIPFLQENSYWFHWCTKNELNELRTFDELSVM